MTLTRDRAALDAWYCLDRLEDISPAGTASRLLGQDLVVRRAPDGTLSGEAAGPASADAPPLALAERYGFAWASWGTPSRGVPVIPEADEPDRRVVLCGPVTVRASGLRIVENFLDLAHFPFVHTDILGAEPQTEVFSYKAEIRRDVDEVWATDCRFFQPQAAMSATGGQMVDYQYRVATPFVTLLYKSCPADANRSDVICLFVQPLDEDRCRAHPAMFLVDDVTPLPDLIAFQQMIFLQDRIILENQRPRLLPMTPASEIPTRADATSIAYRRWLKEKGLTYGTLEGRGR